MSFWPFSGKPSNKPDESLQKNVMGAVNAVLKFGSDPANGQHLQKAREKYSLLAGKAFEDDEDYVMRMNTFLEWFIFDYKLQEGQSHTIFDEYMAKIRDSLSSEEMVLRMDISKDVHSLFEVLSCKDSWIKVKDCASRKKYWVYGDDNLEKGDFLEKRIICHGDFCFFTYTHCLHPRQAFGLIKKELKKFRRGGIEPDFLLAMQGKQLTWRRSRQIEMKKIYKF